MTVRAVLFDFGGTLFMPRAVSELVCGAGQELGLELMREDCDRLADACLAAGFPGGPYPEAVPGQVTELYERRDLSSDAHRAAYTSLLSTVELPHPDLAGRLYEQIRQPSSWVPYADTHELLDELAHRGVKAGVVSNVGFDLRPILHDHGLQGLARHCTMSFEVGATKPDRRIFEAALRSVGSEATDTLMVGDHEQVDRGAEALGAKTIILPMTAPGGHHGLSRVLDLL